MKIIFNKYLIGLFAIVSISTNLYAANTSSWNQKPTSVAAGQTYTVKVNYTLNEPGLLHVQIFNSSWTKIGQTYSTSAIPAGSGTATLQLPINTGTPSATGNILQAKLLKSNWGDLGVPVLEVINITEDTGSNANSSSWNQKPSSVAAGVTYEVKVNYTLSEPGLIHVQIFNNSWTKIGQIYSTSSIPAGSGTATLQLPINTGTPSATGNILQAKLLKSSWADLGVPVLEVTNITGRGTVSVNCETEPSDLDCDTETSFCTTYIGPNNIFPSQKKLLPNNENELNNIYEANMYVNNWKGCINATWEFPDEGDSSGKNFKVTWDNDGTISGNGSHAEFDYKVLRANWTYHATDNGYPTKIGSIGEMEECWSEGGWSVGSEGKCQINITAWISEPEIRYESGDSRKCSSECDIIIHTWDNSEGFKNTFPAFGEDPHYYENEEICQPSKTQEKRNLGNIIFDPKGDGVEVTYEVFRTKPGGAGEKASYNIIPKNIQYTFETETQYNSIDVKHFINGIMSLERTEEVNDIVFNGEWYLQGMEWTVVGQSGDEDIGDSKGEWTFENYYIPDIPSISGNSNKMAQSYPEKIKSNINSLDLNISPNPFSNSFDIEFSSTKEELVTIKLFSQNGKLIKVIESDVNEYTGSHIENLDTEKLPRGIYFINLTSSDKNIVQKVVKF